MEFARDLVTHFNRWCSASEVKDFNDLSDLMVLEQFKNSVPERIAMYICEKKVKTAAEAAALAEYLLTHRGGCGDLRTYAFSVDREGGPAGGLHSSGRPGGKFNTGQRSDRIVHESEDFCQLEWGKGASGHIT